LLTVKPTTRSLRDLRLSKRRGNDLDKLETIVDLLPARKSLPVKHRDHRLSGHWRHHRECHIEPDWLLIYRIDEDFLFLERTGTHADLFE